MKRSLLGAAALAAMLAISSAATAAVIASESFESPALTAPADQYGPDEDSFDTGSTGPVVISNFTFSGFTGIMTNGLDGIFPDTASGTQVAFLQSYHSGNGEIDWALTGLTPGHEYALSFEDVSSLTLGATPFSVSAYGGTAVDYAPGASFMTQTLDFTPSAADGSIRFIGGLEGPNSDTAIDNLTISTVEGAAGVPEPASWLMMILGCGMVGAGLRYGRRTASQMAA
jgi:hypothetical protein